MFTPTKDQEIALGKIREFLHPRNKESTFVLMGVAGSGKSTVVSVITEELYLKGKKSLGGSFTNKATNVLAKKNPYMNKRTLFQMLNLKADETSENLSFFRPNKDEIDSDIAYHDLIILDEVSMVQDDLLKQLIEEVEYYGKKLLLMGDKYQLPPIDQKHDSFAFSLPNQYELTEIIRQGSESSIPLYAGQIRDILDKVRDGKKVPITTKLSTTFLKESPDVLITKSGSDFLNMFLEDFNSDEYKRNSDYVKVVAYRNVTIDKINELIRKSLFEDAESPIVEGDQLILTNAAYAYDVEEMLQVFDPADEIKIKKVITRKIYDKTHLGVKVNFPYCICQAYEKEANKYAEIAILYPAFKDKFEEQMKAWAKEINKLGGYERKRVFKQEFYPFKKRYNIPKYAYAMTSHSIQGSTVNKAYVVMDDIEKVPADTKTLWASKYVSCSRPSDKLIILDRNP